MLKITRTLIALAVASVAIPAAAGSWPNIPKRTPQATATAPSGVATAIAAARPADGFIEGVAESGASLEQYRYFRNEENERPVIVARTAAAARPQATAAGPGAGYTFVSGETGWQLNPHRLVWAAGRIAHSDECDHAIRVARAPTPAELDSARTASPGA